MRGKRKGGRESEEEGGRGLSDWEGLNFFEINFINTDFTSVEAFAATCFRLSCARISWTSDGENKRHKIDPLSQYTHCCRIVASAAVSLDARVGFPRLTTTTTGILGAGE